jgi:hypothetical protein
MATLPAVDASLLLEKVTRFNLVVAASLGDACWLIDNNDNSRLGCRFAHTPAASSIFQGDDWTVHVHGSDDAANSTIRSCALLLLIKMLNSRSDSSNNSSNSSSHQVLRLYNALSITGSN